MTTQEQRIQDAFICMVFIVGMTLGALSVYHAKPKELTPHEVETINATIRFNSYCGKLKG